MRGCYRLPLLLIAAALPGAAQADITAIYGAPGRADELSVEIADNGDARLEVGDARVAVLHDDAVILFGPSGDEPAISDRRVDEALGPIAPAAPGAYTIKALGPVAVGARTGQSFSAAISPGSDVIKAPVTVSADPALAPLARALPRLFRGLLTIMRFETGRDADADMRANISALLDILSRGALLKIGDAALKSVSFDPIPPQRFTVPVASLGVAEIRTAFDAHVAARTKAEAIARNAP